MSRPPHPQDSVLRELERVLVLTRQGVDELQDRRIALENLDHALALISAAREDEGNWLLVPREATAFMVSEARRHLFAGNSETNIEMAWSAMVEASKHAPPKPLGEGEAE